MLKKNGGDQIRAFFLWLSAHKKMLEILREKV
jgi:hypothetical protein